MHADANTDGHSNVDADTDRDAHACTRQLWEYCYDL
jgi:hypothetical protein